MVILESNSFSRYNNNITFNISVKDNDKIYFGYLNGNGDGAIIIEFEKYVSFEFKLITDPNQNVSVGSEVRLNGGSYCGKLITKGFTRICYLGNDAPDKSSRLKYKWKSSNNDIAIVSSYGTITAVRPGRAIITATFKEDETKVGNIEIDVIPDYDDSFKTLMHGFDVREGGTRSGTEVTSGLGSPIDIAISPYVKIHIGYTRLICLGNDSPNASVQAFDWIAYNEMGTSQGMVTVSQFGTITGTISGWVTIRGTYKYNTKYIVIITILVI